MQLNYTEENILKILLRLPRAIAEKNREIISNILGKQKRSTPDPIIIDDKIVTDPLIIATNFNTYSNIISCTLSDSVIDIDIPFGRCLVNAIPEQPISSLTNLNEINLIAKKRRKIVLV